MDNEQVIIKLHPEPEEYLEAETAFLRAVGLCVTRWAFVDRQLFWFFRFGLGAATHRAAVVYYNQQTIGRRLGQVEDLLEGIFANGRWKEESEEWNTLRSRMKDFLPTRNIIAHQPVRRVGTSDGKKAIYVYSIYIEPFQRHLNKTFAGLRGKNALETEDLIVHANDVETLEESLQALARKVLSKSRSLHKSSGNPHEQGAS